MYVLEKNIKLKKNMIEIVDVPNLVNINYIPYQVSLVNDKHVVDLTIQVTNKNTNGIVCDFDKSYFVISKEIDLNTDDIKHGIAIQLKLKYIGNQAYVMLNFQILYKKTIDSYKLLSRQYMNRPENIIDMMNDILKYENAKKLLITTDNDIKHLSLKSKFHILKGKLWDDEVVLYTDNVTDVLPDTGSESVTRELGICNMTDIVTKHENSFTYELNFTKLKNSRTFKHLQMFDLNIDTRSNDIYMNIYGLE